MASALEVVLLRGFCTNPGEVYASFLSASTTSHSPLRVSVVSGATPAFSGTSYDSPFVTMPLSMFATHTFPLADASGSPLRYYLTQCCLWAAASPSTGSPPPAKSTASAGGTQAPCLFQALASTYKGMDLQATVEALVEPSTAALAQCNVWWCGGEGGVHTTGVHWDAVHNLLCVLRGRKRVLLLPPAAGPHLQECPLHAATPNHAQASLWGGEGWPHGGGSVGALPPPSLPPGLPPAWCCDVTVEAGDALYIPEGWWHTVASEPGTLALNWWFSGEAVGGVRPWEERYHTRAGVLNQGREAMRARNQGLRREAELAARGSEWASPVALASALSKGVQCDQALVFASQRRGLVLDALLELHPSALPTLLHSLLPSTVDIITLAWEKEEEEEEGEGEVGDKVGELTGLVRGVGGLTRVKKFELLWRRAFPRDPETEANAFLAKGKEEGLRLWLESQGGEKDAKK
jgi:hypothetical protein